jgi:hypothetical protein
MKSFSETLSRLFKGIFNPRFSFEDGSWMEFAGREGLLYGEPDGHLMFITIYAEIEKRRCKRLYWKDIRKWRPPHELEPVDNDKQEEIGRRIGRFLQRMNYRLEISRDP